MQSFVFAFLILAIASALLGLTGLATMASAVGNILLLVVFVAFFASLIVVRRSVARSHS